MICNHLLTRSGLGPVWAHLAHCCRPGRARCGALEPLVPIARVGPRRMGNATEQDAFVYVKTRLNRSKPMYTPNSDQRTRGNSSSNGASRSSLWLLSERRRRQSRCRPGSLTRSRTASGRDKDSVKDVLRAMLSTVEVWAASSQVEAYAKTQVDKPLIESLSYLFEIHQCSDHRTDLREGQAEMGCTLSESQRTKKNTLRFF